MVKKFYENKPMLYFFVARKAEADLCEIFVDEVSSKLGIPIIGKATSFATIFKDKKQPLFGRQTATMHVRPFRPSVLKEIMSEYCPDYKKSDLLALYTLTGEELRRRGPEGQIRAVLQSCRSLQGIRYCIQRVIHRRHVVCEYQQSAPNIKNCHQRLNLRSLFVIYL